MQGVHVYAEQEFNIYLKPDTLAVHLIVFNEPQVLMRI